MFATDAQILLGWGTLSCYARGAALNRMSGTTGGAALNRSLRQPELEES